MSVQGTWLRRGCGIELPHAGVRARVINPIAPTHDAETQDRLTLVTWADALSLIATKRVEAQTMTSEAVHAWRKKEFVVSTANVKLWSASRLVAI